MEAESSCCIAASVEAKRLGVKTGTRVHEARRLCPEIVLVKARPRFYVEVHHRWLAAVDRQAPIDKVYSIDEAAVRLAANERAPDAALALARRIKAQLAADVGPWVTCSIGLAPSRLLAKVATDLHKPDGLTLIDMDAMPGPIAGLKLDDLCGIGPGMLRRLHGHGVYTIEQLWGLSLDDMRGIWGGVGGAYYYHGLHGIDAPEVPTHRSSMGHEHVLPPHLRHDAGAYGVLTRLLHKGAARLREQGYDAHRLALAIRLDNGRRWRDEIDLPGCRDTLTLLEHLAVLWRRRPPWSRCPIPRSSPRPSPRSGPRPGPQPGGRPHAEPDAGGRNGDGASRGEGLFEAPRPRRFTGIDDAPQGQGGATTTTTTTTTTLPATAMTAAPSKVGITLLGLTADAASPGQLFPDAQRREALSRAMDRANARFGGHSVYFAGMHDVGRDRYRMEDKIAFGRVPDEAVEM